MRVGSVAEQPSSDPLKALVAAVAHVPAQPLREVDDFVFEQSLERFQPVLAGQAADGHLWIVCRKTVEQDRSGHRNLEMAGTVRALKARGLPTGACHPAGESEGDAFRVKQPRAQPIQEASVVGGEQKR